MAELLDRILKYFQQMDPAGVDSMALAVILEEDHQKIVGAIKSLQSIGGIIEAEQMHKSKLELTAEGKYFVKHGSHEAIVYHAVPAGDQGILQADLFHKCPQSGKIGLSKAIKSGWVHLKKDGKDVHVCRTVKTIVDDTAGRLTSIAEGKEHTLTDTDINELKKRKLLTQAQVAYYHVRRGANFSTTLEKPEADLTPEMMATGEWKTKHFKPYNFEAKGAVLPSGHLHPLMKVRSEFRQILLEMGFSEMPTNRFVESSFWNFDALYVPQKHPARDAQDTFFMSRPAKARSVPMEYLSNVKAAHTGKGYGTLGYGPVWKEEEAYKNVLRTHTTAVSARMLYEIGSQKPFKPAKLFSIDRVFRNETLDATHLAEFHQVEGVVADYKLSLGTLIGLMKEFFKRLGIDQIRFKPAYNPYTEPSMEVFSYHEGLKKWVEVGNSGMFRPEMLEPMGLPKDVRIVAWGLSLERPTMIRYGIDNIRDLVGHKVDLQMVYDNALCRLDKKLNKEENKKDKAGKKEDKENDKAAKKEKKKPKENKENAKGGNKEKKDETSFDNGTEEAGPSLDEDKPLHKKKKNKSKSKKQEAESPSSPPAAEVTFSKPIPLPAPPPPEQSPTEAVATEEKVAKSKNKKRKKKSKKGNTTENTDPPTNGPKLETSQTGEAIKSEEVEIPVPVVDFGVAPVLLETLPEKTSKKKQKQKRQEQSSSTSTASEISAETLESLLPVVPVDKFEDLTSPTTEPAISLSSSVFDPQDSVEPVPGTTQQQQNSGGGGGKKKKRNRKPKDNNSSEGMAANNPNPLTSHVLDTATGRPAPNLKVILSKQEGNGQSWRQVAEQLTDADGRVGNLIPGADFTPGVYKLYFDTQSYYRNRGEKTFYPYVEIVFEIEKPEEHYHVPILLSAFGYTTYRGS